MDDFTATVHSSIGYLDNDKMIQSDHLRTIEFAYKQNADDDALLLTRVDPSMMARSSEYFCGMFRTDPQTGKPLFESSKELVNAHMTAEIATDLDRMLHGARFTRDWFRKKSDEYLIRLGYIADMILFPELKKMLHEVLYWSVLSVDDLGAKLDVILKVLKYSLAIHDAKLSTKVLKVVQFHEYRSKPEMFAKIHDAIVSSDPLMVDIALGLL